jgi:TonB-linked SusC/RagA family outer membrane protein
MYDKFMKHSHFGAKIKQSIKIMRLMLIFMLSGLGVCNANIIYSQSTYLSLSLEHKSVREIFDEIESNSEYIFFYYDDIVDLNRIVSINVENKTIDKILDRLFESTNNTYVIDDRQIFISQKEESVMETTLQQQSRTITGTVKDDLNEPIIGANIVIKGTTTGTTSDADGNFSLTTSLPNPALIISYIGYLTQEIVVDNSGRPINIRLTEGDLALDEVVVVGYGTQKKISVTGAIASVQTKELKQSSAPNLAAALAGRLPGLVTAQTTGQPGRDDVTLYLRGVGTTNGASPLILIDGVPRDNISTLDPNEVASVSILKDASATAVFGVRGANGVILITTRRGTTGKAELSVTANYSLQKFLTRPDRVHSWEYAELRNQAMRNDGVSEENLPFTPYMIEKYKDGSDPVFYPDRDTYHELFRDWAPQSRINVNLNGGADDLQYFLNVGYIGQGGLFKTESKSSLGYDPSFRMDRYNFRGNVDYNITKGLKLSMNLATYLDKMNAPLAMVSAADEMDAMIRQIMAFTWSIPPTDPGPVTVAGYGHPANQVIGGAGGSISTYGDVNRRGYRQETNTMLNSSAILDWDLNFITKGLSTKLMVSYDAKSRTNLYAFRQYNRYAFHVARSPEDENSYSVVLGTENESISLSKTMQSYYYMNLQYSLNYARQFDRHDIGGMALFQRDIWERKDYAADLPFNLVGFVGRVTYGYDSRYLAEVNVGYNGSEQFAEANRFGLFPAFSAGWVISNESFLKNNTIISNLKLRASYGIVGNDQLGGSRFLYLSHIQETGGGWIAPLNYGKRIVQGMVGNDQLQWEVAHKQNYGIDIQLLQSLSVSLDVFNEKRDHILITRGTVPELQGVALSNLPKLNMGEIDNHGYEIELTYQKQLNSDLSVMVKGNYAYNRNKVIYTDEAILSADYAYRYRRTGYSIGQPFGYPVDYSNGNGFINTPEELAALPEYQVGGNPRLGDLKFIDVNNDGRISPEDQVPMGYGAIPRVSYGFSGSINYKSLDFSFLFAGIAKSSLMYNNWGVTEFGLVGVYSGWHLNAWTADRYQNGENITYPALSTAPNSSTTANEFFLLDRSYLRLKNIELGYNFPQRLIKPAGINRMRIFMSGDNLLTWKTLPINTVDPEQITPNLYPITKMVNIGINVVF